MLIRYSYPRIIDLKLYIPFAELARIVRESNVTEDMRSMFVMLLCRAVGEHTERNSEWISCCKFHSVSHQLTERGDNARVNDCKHLWSFN